jgi:hypothetical protein
MLTRKHAIFVAAVLVLTGADLAQYEALLVARFFTDQLPANNLFRYVFSFVWIPVAALAGWVGLRAGYLAIRRESLPAHHLMLFGALMCPTIKVDSTEVGWCVLRLSVNLGWDRLALGCNFVGIAFLLWLGALLRRPTPSAIDWPHRAPGDPPSSGAPSN